MQAAETDMQAAEAEGNHVNKINEGLIRREAGAAATSLAAVYAARQAMAEAEPTVWDGTGEYAGQEIVPDFNRPASERLGDRPGKCVIHGGRDLAGCDHR